MSHTLKNAFHLIWLSVLHFPILSRSTNKSSINSQQQHNGHNNTSSTTINQLHSNNIHRFAIKPLTWSAPICARPLHQRKHGPQSTLWFIPEPPIAWTPAPSTMTTVQCPVYHHAYRQTVNHRRSALTTLTGSPMQRA